MPDVTIIQTADTGVYHRMLQATARTAREFCRRHDFEYRDFVGIKRGVRPANASYNRIIMLEEMVAEGYDGWVLYLDADAYVYDLDFDLRGYLARLGDRAAVIATIDGEDVPWHVNSGVLLVNLGHDMGRALVLEWAALLAAIGDEQLAALDTVWNGLDDQTLLFTTLRDHPPIRDAVFFERAINLNHVDGLFIRQYLAAFDTNVESRTDSIERAVQTVLAVTPQD